MNKISNTEKKLLNWIENQSNIIFFVITIIFGAVIRLFGIKFISGDMKSFLIPWANYYRDAGGGFDLLKDGVGNYNIIYQIYIILICNLKHTVFLYKFLSVFFDYLLAFTVGLLLIEIKHEKLLSKTFNIGFATVLFMPTVILNSAWWGQCDSIYCTFCILTLYFLIKEKHIISFIFFGIALAFKLQSIFLLPFLICYYFYNRNFSVLYFFIPIFVFWATGIPAFINGRSLLAPFSIYFSQTSQYKSMFLNIISFWILVGDNFSALKFLSVFLTLMILCICLYLALQRRIKLNSIQEKIIFSVFTVWTCVFFLPAMHERYTYLLDVLLVMLALSNIRFIKYAIFSIICSLLTYGKYLFENDIFVWGGVELAIIYLYLYVNFFIKETIEGKTNEKCYSNKEMDW